MGLGRIVQMLKTSKEFDFVYKNSYKFRSESLDICVLKPNLAGQFYEKFRKIPCSLVGFSVSKKVGNAVERNLIKRRLRAICREFFGNSSLGMQFRTCENFWESTDSSLVLSQKFSQTQKPHRKYFDCDLRCKSTTNQTQNCNNSSLRGVANAEAIQKSKMDCHENSLRSFSRNDGVRQNIICIFIAKKQILQTPFATLKSTIFTTLKKQLNFRQGSYKKSRTGSPHNAQNRISQNHAKGTL